MSNSATSLPKTKVNLSQSLKKEATFALDENKRKIDELLRNGKPILQPLKMEKEPTKPKPETSTNIQLISKSTPIEIIPPEVIIRDIEINQTYEVTILVRNLTNHARRIRCFQPKTSYFRCDYDIQGAVAAGLAMKLVLSFETNQSGDYHDELEIISEDFKAKILLHAFLPQANIVFDPFVNLGFCQVGREKIGTIAFKNEGKREGTINLKFEKNSSGIKIDPTSFKIKPQEKKTVKLIYQPRDAGILRGIIEVDVEGQSILKHIDISATSVDYFIFIIDENGNQCTNFDFGNIYFGQEKEIEGYLVNNSPKKFNFKTKFLLGFQSSTQEVSSFQTPSQMGLEQTQRIMYCTPESGTIDSYSQMLIKFICRSRVTENMEFWTRYYAMTKEKEPDHDHPMIVNEYTYSCFFEFDENNELSAIMHLEARGICPTIKISSHMVEFGDCDVNDRRDYQITLENMNDQLPIDFGFSKPAQFSATPKKGRLNPHQKTSVILSFEPKNLGKFQGVIHLELLDFYKIPINAIGSSSNYKVANNPPPTRGIESLPIDYQVKRQFVSEDKLQRAVKRPKNMERLIFTSGNTSTSNLLNLETTNVSEKLDEHFATKNNREKYNTYLKDLRQKRYDEEKGRQLKEKFDIRQEKPEEKIPIPAFFTTRDFDTDENKLIHPYDAQFWFGTNSQVVEQPKLKLNEANDPLYVLKPLGKYEPAYIEKTDNFRPDPNKPIRKIYPSKPSSQSEYRYCTTELTPEELQKVFAGPSLLDFGIVYVKSKVMKTFSVRNELKHCIMAKLDIEDVEELRQSYIEPQIIPSMQTAGFEIVLCSKILQNFKGTITYNINSKHNFKFLVSARIDPVKLELSKTELRLGFPENNMEMEISEIIKITNNGNAPGKFRWEIPAAVTNILSVKPDKGEVPAKGSLDLNVIYSPSGNVFRGEGDKLTMKVEDGDDQILYCVGVVSEAKCALKVSFVDLGDVPVSNTVIKYFSIKNTFKNVAVFYVNTKLPPHLTVSPMKGKIPSDQSQDIAITFNSPEEIQIKQDIIINIRGGKPLRLAFSANALIPKVMIKEYEFDFGSVIYGNSSSLPLTIVNEGTIPANLEVNLEEKDGIKELDGVECLDIMVADGYGEDDSSVMLSLNKSMDDKLVEERDPSDNGDDDDDSELVPQEKQIKRQFQVIVKPKTTLKFILKFTPKDVKNYLMELPISLKGYGKIEPLRRNIACKGTKPRFLLEPQQIEFKKKIITAFETKSGSTSIDIEISNPDIKLISWAVDMKPYDDSQPFYIKPSQGKLESGQKSMIKVYFQPTKQDDYQEKAYILLDGDTKPYLEISLKGTGAFPKLAFDRREIILPIVPLDIESKCTFKIINDGFENLTLKYKLSPEASTIPLQVIFPEGLNLGITKNKLRVDAIFKNKKPLSFTTEIQFIDDANHIYPIKISGTTDNCLLTNFSYLLRNSGDYEILVEEAKAIRIQEKEDVESDSSPRGTSVAFSRVEKHSLGYRPIPSNLLEKACDFIVRWLKENGTVQQVLKFPNDVIENNGAQIFEVLTFLTGKNINLKAKFDNVSKRNEKIKVIQKQYDDLIQFLKGNGALLNTIRPEFLLKFSDYKTFIKMNPNVYVHHTLQRPVEKNFAYLSVDAWITLFYQILKIYYLGRVNLRLFKTLAGIPSDKLSVPDYYLEGSNLYNVSEGLLLRWLEIHYEIMRGVGQAKRLQNFDNSLRDGHYFATVIQSYVGASYVKTVSQLKQVCTNEDDYKYNAEKIIKGLEEIGLQSNFTAKDIYAPSQRENILFVLFLYNNLPHYIPKQTIEFSCTLEETLVKHIELKNTTNKTICYWVKLEAHPDFSIDTDIVRLEPNTEPVKFPITYVSRVSAPVTGRIIFTNHSDGNQRAAAIVFDLKSNITGRKSRAEIKIDGKLYELKAKDIQVENPFNSDADYIITLIHEKIKQVDNTKGKKKVAKDAKKEVQKPEEDYIIPGFYVRRERIQIRKNNVATLQIQFLPFIMETQKCFIVFCDEKVGEIQYTLIGEVALPNVIEPMYSPAPFYLEGDMNCSVTIKFKNPLIEKAKKIHFDRLPLIIKSNELEKDAAREKAIDQINLDIESLTQYITFPPQMTLIDYHKKGAKIQSVVDTKDKKKKPSVDSSTDSIIPTIQAGMENKLSMALNFKTPIKDQEFKFMLKNQAKTDIRIFAIKLTILPKPVKANIEMVIPARKTITQEIPIINNSDKDWSFKVELKNNDPTKPWFSGPTSFTARKKVKSNYLLTFKPSWCMTVEGKLNLYNTVTSEQFEYELRGIGEEPLAEDHIILHCKAKAETFHEIVLSNPYDHPLNYNIETDLPNPKGETQFTIPAKKSKNYKFSVTPILGGNYTGSITFFDQDQRYVWYIIELKVENQKSEKPPIDLITTVRKAIAFDISLSNPLKETANFDVLIEGSGLLGPSIFSILPGQSASYELVFSPLKPTNSLGSITFVNENLGETRYDFKLIADEQPTVRLPTLKCELGKVEANEVELENPSSKQVKVNYRLSNPHNFDISPDEIYIPAYSSIHVSIIYMPSELDVMENGEVIFESDDIGRWTFLVFGTGLPPTKFEEKVINGALNKDSSSTINFKNPFREAITVAITLEVPKNKPEAFGLLLKKTKTQVGPLSTIQIPFSFMPRAISEYYAEIIVAMNEKITWRYPIKGITESFSNITDFYLKTKCRTKCEQELKINLPGVADTESKDIFVLEFVNVPKESQNALSKWLTIAPIKNTMDHSNDHLIFHAKFVPMKPLKTTLEIAVVKQSGGRWKFKLILEASDPDPDDTIFITSPINKTASVSFKLTNAYKHSAEFFATFSPESDPEFTVQPKTGYLDAYGKEGTTFIISFSPVEYGKMKLGKLIIQTDEMYWSYQLRGDLPKYVIPDPKMSKVESRLQPEIEKKLLQGKIVKKNHLAENIKKTTNISPHRDKERGKNHRSKSSSRSRSRSPS